MAKYTADEIPCCVTCDRFNQTKSCLKCGVSFCKHYASTTDIRFCANCMGDFTLKETIMEKVVERERPDGTISFSRKYQARHITLQGNDWLFTAHLIEVMSDDEIEASIEYHKANASLMLQERESRKLERIHRLAAIKVPNIRHESQEQREKREAKEAAKAGRVTKTKEIDANAIIAAITALGKSGLTQQQIVEMLGKRVKK